jgi:outer membrane lipoprotein-sorting protein
VNRRLRTVSTFRLLVSLGAVVLAAAAAAAIAIAAAGAGPTPPPKPLAQAIRAAVTAPKVDGIRARVSFTNTLLPSGALTGRVGSALMSGATGRLWVTNDGRGRLELQSDAGDTQVLWNARSVTVYDASSHTAYRLPLPAHTSSSTGTSAPPTLQQITGFLAKLGNDAAVSAATPSDVAGQPAYTVSVSPKTSAGLIGSLQLAWDASHGVPLRIALYARGSSTPVLALSATDISYGPVSAGSVDVPIPADAKVVDLRGLGSGSGSERGATPPVSGLAAVQAAAPFTVVAPDALGGLPRSEVRLEGGKTVLLTYGQGLGAILVVERPADAAGQGSGPAVLGSLPSVSINGSSAHELSTQLGTVLQWQTAGVSYTLAGSVPAATAEAAARALR